MKIFSPAEAAALASPGDVVHIAGCCGEPGAILDAVGAEPSLWRDVHLVGAFIPGVNDRDLSALGQHTTISTIFATGGLRQGRTAGKLRHWPLHYTEFYRFLESPGAVQIGYVQVPPPRNDGTVSFGIAPDFTPALVPGRARLIGLINPAMPDPIAGPRVPVERFEGFVEVDTQLIEYDAGPVDEPTAAIGRTIVSLLAPGDTLQLGLGKVQAAVLQNLGEVEDLGFHGGMISAPILDPLRRSVFSRGVTTGVALGSKTLYREAAENPHIRFAPVGYTHSIHTLADIPRFVSINSVIEVDLFGQANAESMGGQQVSGQGGLVDFVRGARASTGGRSILALSSTANRGSLSRIVAAFAPGTPTTVTRADVDLIVTEHGVADLRHASLEERAERIIAVAHPTFRQVLAEEWAANRSMTMARPSRNKEI
jgi:acyl-CoA hydrolase